jgi:hypothetical protein
MPIKPDLKPVGAMGITAESRLKTWELIKSFIIKEYYLKNIFTHAKDNLVLVSIDYRL